MTKRPLEREGDALRVVAVNRGAPCSTIKDELESWLHPLSLEEFRAEYFRNKGFAVKVHPSLREKRLEFLSGLFDDFRPMDMLQNSASDGIHVWMKVGAEMKSIKTDPVSAKTCYDAGHALYFRAPPEAEATLLDGLSAGLGLDFAHRHRDGARRAEIETFVARPGHVTDWHFDFQENFTVQLKGCKKWSMAKATVQHPYRAAATHFNGDQHRATLATQFQVARAGDQTFDGVPADIESTCESVVLQSGDVLYHPAGIWHKVEVVGDESSLSINLSFFPQSFTELIVQSLQHRLNSLPQFRERVCFTGDGDFHARLDALLHDAASELGNLRAADLVPPPSASQIHLVSWDDKGVLVNGQPFVAAARDAKLSKLRRNPLARLSRTAESCHTAVVLGADSDDEEEEEEAPLPEGYTRFDLASNFMVEDATLGVSPSVSVAFFVHESHVAAMQKLCDIAAGAEVSAKSIPLEMRGPLLEVGYLSVV